MAAFVSRNTKKYQEHCVRTVYTRAAEWRNFIDSRNPSLIVIDDLMRDATNSKDVCERFVEGSHHRNISVACIMQNAFFRWKENRTININSQYVVLFKNPRDQLVPMIFARDMYPNNIKKFMNKYTEATKRPYGYVYRSEAEHARGWAIKHRHIWWLKCRGGTIDRGFPWYDGRRFEFWWRIYKRLIFKNQ